MVYASVHGADEWCWHILFALWVCGNELTSLGHDLHVTTHPFQGPTAPIGWAGFGQIWQNRLDRSDVLWCVPLCTELMSATGMFNLAF